MATPELRFLMDREMVPIDLQNQFHDAGITSVPQFAAFVPNSDELRKSLKEDFGIDPSTGLPAKIAASKVIVAWEAARVRSTKLAEAEADAEIRQEPKPVRGNDFKIMTLAY